MMKNVEITVSYKIEKLHEDMIKVLKYFGKFTLIDSDEQMSKRINDFTIFNCCHAYIIACYNCSGSFLKRRWYCSVRLLEIIKCAKLNIKII